MRINFVNDRTFKISLKGLFNCPFFWSVEKKQYTIIINALVTEWLSLSGFHLSVEICSVIGEKKTRATFSINIRKTNQSCSHAFCPSSFPGPFLLFPREREKGTGIEVGVCFLWHWIRFEHWLARLMCFLRQTKANYLGFGFTTRDWKALFFA